MMVGEMRSVTEISLVPMLRSERSAASSIVPPMTSLPILADQIEESRVQVALGAGAASGATRPD